MGRFADYVASYVDNAIRSLPIITAVGTVVTSPGQVSTDPMTVVVDGSATSVPVKQVRGLPLSQGARVVLIRFGSDWVIIGSLTNPAVGTGTSRMVIGADTPVELKQYGIDTAIISYITDVVSGLEVGYFFIGTSNRFDGGGNNRVQAFGNVVYPTPGVPSSATMSSVKTNFQQDMFAPFPQTIFKDQTVELWTDFNLRWDTGFRTFDIDGRAQGHGTRGNGYSTGTITTAGAETAHPTASWAREPSANNMRTGRVYRFSWKGNIFISGGTIALALGTVRIRQGATATSTPSAGVAVCTSYVEAQTNFASHGDSGYGYGTPAVAGNYTFSLSLQKGAGTGSNLNCGGDAAARMTVEIEDVGKTADWAGMYDTF